MGQLSLDEDDGGRPDHSNRRHDRDGRVGDAGGGGDSGFGELGFRGPEVCKIAGISYRQLDYWTRTGLVSASLAQARGSGTPRLYAYTDLVEVRVVKQLLDGGLSLQRARKAIEYLRENLGEELASANLVIDSDHSVLTRSDGEIVDLLHKGQGVLNVIPLSGLKEELDARIHELAPAAERSEPSADGAPGSPGGAERAAEG